MPELHTRMLDIEGTHSLVFYCGDLGADPAVVASGHEPNGYFWEGLVSYLMPELAARVELDSEAGMFSAVGDPSDLAQIKAVLDPLLDDPARVTALVERAESDGHEFDD